MAVLAYADGSKFGSRNPFVPIVIAHSANDLMIGN